jgi:hypothetical protein
LNLIEGSNVTLTIADDSGNEEVDVTIAASGGGGVFGTEQFQTLSYDYHQVSFTSYQKIDFEFSSPAPYDPDNNLVNNGAGDNYFLCPATGYYYFYSTVSGYPNDGSISATSGWVSLNFTVNSTRNFVNTGQYYFENNGVQLGGGQMSIAGALILALTSGDKVYLEIQSGLNPGTFDTNGGSFNSLFGGWRIA